MPKKTLVYWKKGFRKGEEEPHASLCVFGNSYVNAMAAATLVERSPAISLSKMETDASILKKLGEIRVGLILCFCERVDFVINGEDQVYFECLCFRVLHFADSFSLGMYASVSL